MQTNTAELVKPNGNRASVALEPHFDPTTRHLTPAMDRRSNLRRGELPFFLGVGSFPISFIGVMAGCVIGTGAPALGVATALPVLGTAVAVTSGVVGLTLTIFGFKLNGDAGKDRAHWLELAAREMSESTGIEVTRSELTALGYPDKLPEVDSQTFGSIERVSTNENGSSTLERIALIWADGQFKLLSTNTGLKEQRELT